MFDTHFHLDKEDDAQKIYNDAQAAGVEFMTLIGCDPESCDRAQATAEKFENMYFSAGVHPLYVADFKGSVSDFEKYYTHPKNVAVGEIGLDFFYEKENHAEQIAIFEAFLEVSKRIGKPAVIHSREAFPETIASLKKVLKGEVPFILHCYTGDDQWVQEFLDLGGYISYSGIVTFNNAKELRSSLALVPQERILIETDSPYLAPVPMRGKRNQPAYVAHVRDRVAKELNMPADNLGELAKRNAKKVFNLDV